MNLVKPQLRLEAKSCEKLTYPLIGAYTHIYMLTHVYSLSKI